ncbi:unnamed protein product [Closterium sp. Naga37s-1]|nr:unnamed protein product [Closterium sp. Naga37s-1]
MGASLESSSTSSSSPSSPFCTHRRPVVSYSTNSKVISESTLRLSLIPVLLLAAFLVFLLSPISPLARLPLEPFHHTPRSDGLSFSATSEIALLRLLPPLPPVAALRLDDGKSEKRRSLPSRIFGRDSFKKFLQKAPRGARQVLGDCEWAVGGRRRLGEGGGDMHARLAPLWDMASRVAVNGTVVIVSANAGESGRAIRVDYAAREPPLTPPFATSPITPSQEVGYEEMLEDLALRGPGPTSSFPIVPPPPPTPRSPLPSRLRGDARELGAACQQVDLRSLPPSSPPTPPSPRPFPHRPGYEEMLESWALLANKAELPQGDAGEVGAACQQGYEEMLENWALHADKVGLRGHSIIFAAERQCFDFANHKWPGQALLLDLEGQFVHEDENVDVSKAIGINSAGFHRVASRRAVYILHLLAFGFSVLYSDIDLALLQNPLPYFAPLSSSPSSATPSPSGSPPAAAPPKEFDVFITADQAWTNGPDHTVSLGEPGLPMVMCSCFLFFRPSAGAKALAAMWAFSMVERGHEIGLDQDHLLDVMKIMRERGIEANIGVLPGKKFPSGELMANDMMGFLGLKPGVVMVHANYVVGKRKKIERLIEAGVWLLPPPAPEGEEEGKGEGSGGGSGGGDGTASAGDVAAAAPAAGAGAGAGAPAAAGGEGKEEGQGGEEGEEEMERRLMGVAEWVPSHVDAVLRVAPGVARDGPLILTVLCHASESDLFRSWLGAISKLGLSTNFLASVATQVPLPANAPASHIIRQPASAASTGGSGSEEKAEEKAGEKAEERDRLACLLMPALLASRLLAANITVLFSDPSTVWLRNPLPFLPANFSVLLPSTSHSPTPPTLDTTTPTPLNRSHLGSLSPWLLLLRPSSPSSSAQPPSSPSTSSTHPPSTHFLALSWGLQAFKTLSKEPSLSDKAEGNGESTPLALSVAVQSALNHAIARVVEGERAGEGAGEGAGGEGITIGVLPSFLFPPSAVVCEERQWVQQHREEVVAFHNSCGASRESKASLLKELQLWVEG